MKGVLDILHAWKNVLNKSFEQKREYRWMTTRDHFTVWKRPSHTELWITYYDVTGQQVTSDFSDRAVIPTSIFCTPNTPAIATWGDGISLLHIDGEIIIG